MGEVRDLLETGEVGLVLGVVGGGGQLLHEGGEAKAGGFEAAADLLAAGRGEFGGLAVEAGLYGDFDAVVADVGDEGDGVLDGDTLEAVGADAESAGDFRGVGEEAVNGEGAATGGEGGEAEPEAT